MTILAATSWPSNADLILDVKALGYFDHAGINMDVTYGRGKWWNKFTPTPLIKHDKHNGPAKDGVDFRKLPETDASVTLVAFDPPYVSRGGRDTSPTMTDFNNRYGIDTAPATPAMMMKEIREGMTEINRVLEPGGTVLQKGCDYISSGRLVLAIHDAMCHGLSLGWTVSEQLTHVGTVRAQPSGRRVVHARHNCSTLLVWRNQGRRPATSR